jgi:hypothetical protein
VKKRKVMVGENGRIKGRRLFKEGKIKGKGEMELLSTGLEARKRGVKQRRKGVWGRCSEHTI